MTIPGSESNPGDYLITWNGHGDALGLWAINANDGVLTLANSFTYTTWGAPTVGTHNGYPDLGFRFRYVGKSDVQWDDVHGLGLYYMHARHYSPSLGRFLQPDPSRLDEHLFVYAENGPVSKVDPAGTHMRRVEVSGGSSASLYSAIGRLLRKNNIKISSHGSDQLRLRIRQGRVTEAGVVRTFCFGRLFWDPLHRNYARYDYMTQTVVAITRPERGTIKTVYDDKKPPSRFEPIRWRKGC